MLHNPIIGFGELLWDLLPGGKMPGGAPFNFAFHCHQLGWPSFMVSKLGKDDLGAELSGKVVELGLSTDFIQRDENHKTGTVQVTLNASGHPEYEIVRNVAWDHLEWQPSMEMLAKSCAAVCFGTLGQRSEVTRKTLEKFLSRCSKNVIKVFDINLRQDFYTRQIIDESLRQADWLKLNHEELEILNDLLGLRADDVGESVEVLRRRYKLDLVAVTMGENGCLIHSGNERIYHRGLRVDVADTVGAGDAFTAGMLVNFLKGKSVADSSFRANILASKVASKVGGVPSLNEEERAEIVG